ncbi:unnamed protein product [Prunus brigantina]
MDDSKAEVQDPLLEINLGTEDNHRPIYISGLMEPELRAKMEELLREFKDCFSWDYTEMPGLSRDLVEHRLPTVEDFKPFKQPPRRMSAEKKTGAIRICVDFCNLNLATPKDEYPMPMADLLVDGAAKHEILSFMDGHSGYNQIFIAEEDVHKTAFRCPGSIGTFEHKGVQSLLGQINFLRRFIANSAGKVEPFSSLLKLKDDGGRRLTKWHLTPLKNIWPSLRCSFCQSEADP